MDRRKFMGTLPILSLLGDKMMETISFDKEVDWIKVKSLFPKSDVLNLNSGSAGVMPNLVEQSLIDVLTELNRRPVYKVWGGWKEQVLEIKRGLLEYINADNHSIALSRNATESLKQVIYQSRIEAGKSILIADWDYPNVCHDCKYRCEKENRPIQILSENLSTLEDTELVKVYENAITERTGLVVLTHITHREGRIMPVKQIIKIAKEKGCLVLLDGAQSYGHIHISLSDLNPDFFATSFHKWFNSPLGCGGLFVKNDKRSSLQHPYFPESEDAFEQFENIGTSAYYQWLGLAASLVFNNNHLHSKQKQKRLRFLSDYLRNKLGDDVLFSVPDTGQYAGISSFTFRSSNTKEGLLVNSLYNDFKINTKLVKRKDASYIRVSTNVFLEESDIDKFVDTLGIIK